IARLFQSGQFADVAQQLAGLDQDLAKADTELLAHRAMALMYCNNRAAAAPLIAELAGRQKDLAATTWASVLSVIPLKEDTHNDAKIIQACREAIRAKPQNPYFRLYLGDAYARIGERDLATEQWLIAAQQALVWGAPQTRIFRSCLPSITHE